MTTKTTTATTRYELTWTCNGKPAGFGGFFATREDAEEKRASGKLSGTIKRVSAVDKKTYAVHNAQGAWLCDVKASSPEAARRQVRKGWDIATGDKITVSERR